MKSLNQSRCKRSAGRAKSLVSNYTQHSLPLCLITQAQNTPLFALKTAWIFTQTDDATALSQFSGSFTYIFEIREIHSECCITRLCRKIATCKQYKPASLLQSPSLPQIHKLKSLDQKKKKKPPSMAGSVVQVRNLTNSPISRS